MALSPGPWVKPQYFDNNGLPAASYRLFFYDAGTSTKRDTYQDADQSSLNTNPVVLDSAGRANIFLLPTLYKIVYAAAGSDDPPSSPIWTVDDVGPSSGVDTSIDVSGTAGEAITLNDVCYLSDGSGALTAGRWYKADADQTYSSNGATTLGIATSDIATAASGTFRRDGRMTGLSGLTAGTVYYVSATAGALTSSAPANAIVVGKADSTTSLVMDPQWGVAGAAIIGLVGTAAQTWSGVKTFNSQPQTYVGTATTLPATVGGMIFTDTTLHSVPGASTNLVLSSTSIPANMLNANGKSIQIILWSSVTETGANAKAIDVNIGGFFTCPIRVSGAGNLSYWGGKIFMTRLDSDTLEIMFEQILPTGDLIGIQVENSVDFTAAIVIESLGTTGAASTTAQTNFVMMAIG